MGENHHHHIISFNKNVAVFITLLILTVVTVAAAKVDMGSVLNVTVALLIATTKATCVALWFMHLKFDSWINRIVFISGFFFVALLWVFSVIDVFYR